MAKTRITARFIGTQYSLGYEPRKTYELQIWSQDYRDIKNAIHIQRVVGGGWCPYASVEAFLANWTAIKTQGDL